MRKFIIAGMAAAMLLTPSAAMAKDNAPAYTTDTVGNGGSIKVDKGVATFNIPTNSAYGVIKTFPTNLMVKDIKTLGFKSLSSAGGMVYMNVITNTPDPTTGNLHKIKYTPFDQPGIMEPGIGSWYSHNMLTSAVRFNDAQDGTTAQTWAQAVGQFGNETVNRVSITAGAALGHGTVQVDRMQVNNSVIDFK
jgi:hypothetical protein